MLVMVMIVVDGGDGGKYCPVLTRTRTPPPLPRG